MNRRRQMVWEWNWPRVWSFRRGMQLIGFNCGITWRGDHSPGFHFELMLFNIMLIEFGFYNALHEDEQ